MLNQEEAMAILTLINRVSVNGQEVEQVVYLKNKLKQIAEPKKEKNEKK